MEPLSTAAIGSIVGKLVLGEVAKVLVAGAKSQFQPDKMERVLRKAIETAEKTQQPTQELFFKCSPNAAKKFLEQFFHSVEVLKELQKPLQDNSKPDVAVLMESFKRSAEQEPKIGDNYLSVFLRPWMEKFVESYFQPFEIPFRVAKWQYLEQLAHRVDDVKFVGIAVPGEEVEKQEVLAQIFVMPDVREERNQSSQKSFSMDFIPVSSDVTFTDKLTLPFTFPIGETKQSKLLAEQKASAIRDRSAPRIPAQKVINLAQEKAVVLGAPGSGKTMLASYFALMLCETNQSDPTQIGLEKDADYLPVVVRIRDWILQPNMGLLEYLRSNAEASLACKELPTGFFEHWLERGRALILLDGLDEVVDEAQRRKVAEQIETFLHQYQDNPAVITSRPAGYRWDFFNLNDFPHYMLESFDDKQVATFIDHWYDSRLKDDKAQADRRKTDLQKAFDRNERIKSLARNPLLLTIIALIHRYQAELPRQRYKLYEKAVETLLTSWDSGKEIKLYSQVLQFLKSDDLLYILKKLAYWIHTQGSTGETEGGTLIDKDELIRWLRKEIQTLKKCEAHEAKGEAERFIDFIQRRTGLLNEQGRDRYAFVHKTFQEYLTAEEIFDRADVEDDTDIILSHFREHLHDQHWREVLLLLVSKLKGKKAQKAIQTVLDAGSEYERWLHRDLLFAGWCLTEDPPELTLVAGDLVGAILDRLISLEVSNSEQIGYTIKSEAGTILYCFGEATVVQHVWQKLQEQGDRFDRFRLLEFQAALGQEAEAIATLLPLLSDKESWDVRSRAAKTLGQLGNCSKDVVNGLRFLFSDKNMLSSAASALGKLGNGSADVVNNLLSLLGDDKSNIRSSAAFALGKSGNGSKAVITGLRSSLSDSSSDVRSEAAFALGKLGNSSQEVLRDLRSLLGDEKLSVRSAAVFALGKLGNGSADVLRDLHSLLGDSSDDVRADAANALGQLANSSQEVVSDLCSLLGDSSSNVSFEAAFALGKLGNGSQEVMNIFISLLEDKNSNMLSRAATALVQLGNGSEKVVSILFFLLGDETWDVRDRAATALTQLAKTSDSIRPEVLQWLEQNPNEDRIGSAIDCLWSIVVE